MSEETDEMRNSRLESITLTEAITRTNSKSDEPIICFYMFDWVSWCCQFEFNKGKCCHHNYVCFACCCSISFQ
jgi:hypothetical protein